MWLFLLDDDFPDGDNWQWLMDHVTEEMRAGLLRAAYGILRNRQNVEGVWQNTLILCAMNLRQLRDETRLYAWMYRIMVNECYRYRSRLPGKGVWYDIRLAVKLADPRTDVEETVSSRIDLQRLRDEVDRLEPPDDEIIRLRYFEDRQFHEIASELNMNENTVRSRCMRVLRRLGSRLEGKR